MARKKVEEIETISEEELMETIKNNPAVQDEGENLETVGEEGEA